MTDPIRLTQYSHGAGCGCKIAPAVLETMLAATRPQGGGMSHPRLLVGNETSDDAAVYDLGDGRGLISTTDFFMPIVDDAHTFGRIAATNAISDVYAMGGSPLMAIAILGWPVNSLPPELAGEVLAGGRAACEAAGIPLAGGHSIDSPEPIFGLAVNGLVDLKHLKRNASATEGCLLYLTKALGVGILTTALKKGLLAPEHQHLAEASMLQLNTLGARFGALPYVRALTDVTGFGLLGHLCELTAGSGLSAVIDYAAVPRLEGVDGYIAQGALPGGIARNWASYGHKIAPFDEAHRALLCDPQTSGGLLAAVEPAHAAEFEALCREAGLELQPFGRLVPQDEFLVRVA